MNCAAIFTLAVNTRSALLGVRFPDGWLCVKTIWQAPAFNAAANINWYPQALLIVLLQMPGKYQALCFRCLVIKL